MKSPSDALLRQMTAIDPTTDAAYVAILGSGDEERRDRRRPLSARPDGDNCEFAETVSDEWQHKGLGSALMKRLTETARARGIEWMHSSDSADNEAMHKFADHLNFHHRRDPDDARRCSAAST